MIIWERMGLIQPPEPGTLSLDPIAKRDWIFYKRFPAVIWENVVGIHGPGGICRPADAKHPGKPGSSTLDPIAERTNFSNSNFPLLPKNGNGENLFSPVPFFVFDWPVDYCNRFLKFSFPQVSCGNNRNFSPNSFRKPESRGGTPLARGTGAAEAPALVVHIKIPSGEMIPEGAGESRIGSAH